MAEGGFEFENPEFDRDELDRDDIEEQETFADEKEFHRTLENQYKALDNLTGNTREEHTKTLVKMMLEKFYERNQEPVRFDEDEVEWRVGSDKLGRPSFGIEVDGKIKPLSYYKTNKLDAPIQFHSFDTLQRKYGVDFIRHCLSVSDFTPSAARIKEGRAELANLIKTRDQIATENIPLKDLSSTEDVQNVLDIANNVEIICLRLLLNCQK